MRDVGPSKSELKFRLWFSLAGLAMLIGALLFRGLPMGPAMFEVVAIAGVFFGGTFIWAWRELRHAKSNRDIQTLQHRKPRSPGR